MWSPDSKLCSLYDTVKTDLWQKLTRHERGFCELLLVPLYDENFNTTLNYMYMPLTELCSSLLGVCPNASHHDFVPAYTGSEVPQTPTCAILEPKTYL